MIELRRVLHRWAVLVYFALSMLLAAWSKYRRARRRYRSSADAWPW